MIKVLGASGSLEHNRECISFQVNANTIIDAGNVVRPLAGKAHLVEHVFITHSHFDHILDLPFLIEKHFEKRHKPLTIYGLKSTIDHLQEHLFNNVIWPKFQTIIHPEKNQPLLDFKVLEINQPEIIEGTLITPVSAKHMAGSCGYIVEQNDQACLISGDTYLNAELVDTLNSHTKINSLFIDTSFPSDFEALAKTSQHLTPKLLQQLVAEINRQITIYPYHLKPNYEAQIITELNTLEFKHPIGKVLQSGDSFDLSSAKQNVQPSQVLQPEDTSKKQLNALLTTAQALSSETNVDKLLEQILSAAMEFTQADGGTLYRLTENEKELSFTVLKNHSLDIAMGGTNQQISWPNLPLYLPSGDYNEEMVATFCAVHKELISIPDVYNNPHFNFKGTKEFDQKTGYRSKSMLVVPLLNSNQELVGVLQLLNKQDSQGQTITFSDSDQQHALALASQAAISLTNSLLIRDLEKLFESILATITKAFDEKCSFTGGHVRQVAELSDIIAKGIDADQRFYKDIHYDKDNLHEIRIAALLHDVGKIATPEFIMQKATKLEKTQDRIHWIADRIEILKRDLYIEYLEKHGTDKEISLQTLQQAQAELEQHLNFIRNNNKGAHYLSDEALNKLQTLATLTYKTNIKTKPLLTDDELYNLQTRAGTLNPEEREKIMDHARVSLEILNTLPFPKKYQKVINIAANHHEKLDGTGYPRGLKNEEIGFEDRILVLADLYEALSSKDRPYKEPNKLSTIFKILTSMANAGQIDKKLLRFFYESRTYEVYNQYLNPEQLDEIKFELEDE